MKSLNILSENEINSLLKYAKSPLIGHSSETSGPRNLLLIAIMLDAGLRVGETRQLRISDLLVNEAPVNNILVRPEIAKRQLPRLVPVSQFLHTCIYNFSISIYHDGLSPPASFAFKSDRIDGPMSCRGISMMLGKLSMAAIGRSINPHMLRHTFATRLMKVTSIRVVQQLLGHKSLTSTQVYTHPNNIDMKTAIDQVSINLNNHSPSHNI